MSSVGSNSPSRSSRVVGSATLLPSGVWALALADAAMRADRTILFVLAGRSLSGSDAKSWVPGTNVDADDEVAELGVQIDLANDSEVRGLHRVAIWPDERPREVTAALLRHELEHAHQFDSHGSAARDLFSDAIDALVAQAGGIDGAGVLYQHIPMERDANAAASAFVRATYGDVAVDAHQDADWPLLARDVHTPDAKSVLSRMKKFVANDGPILAKRFAQEVTAGADPRLFRRPSP